MVFFTEVLNGFVKIARHSKIKHVFLKYFENIFFKTLMDDGFFKFD